MAWFPIRLIPNKTSLRFVHYRGLAFVLSALMMAGSIGLVATKGLNLGIDFTGGILIELRTEEPADLATMRDTLSGQGFGEVSLQNFGDEYEVLIRIQANDENQASIVAATKDALDAQYANIDYRRVEYVGPTVGKELVRAGFTALALSLLAMMCYLWFRFEWQFGAGGVVALLHDSIVLMGFYSLLQLDFGVSAIAAVLTVVGYSINDSVVIYDRIRENLRKYKKMSLNDVLDLSINETLSRTVLTGGTTLLALVALALWGGEIIRGFALAIGFGVVIGTYSSVYVAAPILSYLNVRDDEAAAGGTAGETA